MNSLDWTDTIVGLATPQGLGARSILRLAGPHSHDAVARLVVTTEGFTPLSLPWRRRFVEPVTLHIHAWNRSTPATLYAWPENRSATGQAMAEIHLPFTGPVVSALQDELLEQQVRLARPGEFTLRSFLAGRLDLAEAEGVLGLIDAENIDTLREAIDQRTGGLSRPIAAVRSDLLNLLADIEAGLDFVDEDIEFVSEDDITRRLCEARESLSSLNDRLASRAVEEQLPLVVLLGEPNAGKSSLLNALAGAEHVIVSHHAGTTRDRVSVVLSAGDIRIELTDTAGFENASGDIQKQAKEQRAVAVRHADLALCCSPVNSPFHSFDLPASLPRIILRTKSDLRRGNESEDSNDMAVSIHDAASVERLKASIASSLKKIPNRSAAGVTSSRVRQSLAQAIESLDTAIEEQGLGIGNEVVASSLREILDHLGQVVGAVYTDDLLDRVFSRFCIGK